MNGRIDWVMVALLTLLWTCVAALGCLLFGFVFMVAAG